VVDLHAVLAFRAASDDLLRITVKAAGGHSRALFGLRNGTRVIAEGPYGAMTPGRQRSRKLQQIASRHGARLWLITGSRASLGTDPLSAAQLNRHIPAWPGATPMSAGRPG
jgi:hypothetical protein